VATIQELYLQALNSMQQAAVDFQTSVMTTGDQTNAIADLNLALSYLSSVSTDITNSSVESALGKKYKTVVKEVDSALKTANATINKALTAVTGAQGKVEPAIETNHVASPITYAQRKAILAEIEAGAGSIVSAESPLGKPSIANKTAGSSGFYSPGAEAAFEIGALSGCDETPTVTVVTGLGFGYAVDTNTVDFDTANGTLKFKMGTEAGGASIEVSACGETNTILVYNFGETPVPGVPIGFPTDIPAGTYEMEFSATGPFPIPLTKIPIPIKFTSLGAFYEKISAAFNAAIENTGPSQCSISLSYSPYVDGTFSFTWAAVCPDEITETYTFGVTKQK
jgi:hypothetical protein